GAPAEEVLGSGAFDPRSFAAAWAAERGLVGQPGLPGRRGLLRRSRLPAAIAAAFALVAVVGAVLVVPASSSGPRSLRLGLTSRPDHAAESATVWITAAPGPRSLT